MEKYIDAFDSLPTVSQEQLDFPTTDEQIKEFLAIHPKIKVPEKYKNPDWLFKKQEQSEVDLEKEIERVVEHYNSLANGSKVMKPSGIEKIARHFYEMGRNARNEENKQPEYGYITTKYIPGQKPRWKVGDILAYYINNSDEEGEIVLGKVVKIIPDEIGWLYYFEDEVWDEESLITEGTYEK